MKRLYDAIANSPATILSEDCSSSSNIICVSDISVLPDPPGIATIGTGETCETVTYTGVSDGRLTGVIRGVEGKAQSWKAGTVICRLFTAYDYEALRERAIVLDDVLQSNGVVKVSGENLHTANVSSADLADGAVTPEKTSFAENGVYKASGVAGTAYFSMNDSGKYDGKVTVSPNSVYIISNDRGKIESITLGNNETGYFRTFDIDSFTSVGFISEAGQSDAGILITTESDDNTLVLTVPAIIDPVPLYLAVKSVRLPNLVLGDRSVTTDNLADGAVTAEKLSEDVKKAIEDAGNIDLSNYYTKPKTDEAIRDAMYKIPTVSFAENNGELCDGYVNGISIHIQSGEVVIGGSWGGTASAGWSGDKLIIPAYVRDQYGEVHKVTTIGESALVNNSLTNAPEYREARVYIPNTITKFGANCFEQYYGEAGGHLYIVADGVIPSGYDASTTTVYDLSDPFRVVDTDKKMGDIDTALDAIMDIQKNLIQKKTGGDA